MVRATYVVGLLALFVTPAACITRRSGNGGALTLAGQAREQNLEQAWSKELDLDSEASAKKSPIKRVVSLLEEMKAELQKEADKESEMYDKMVCWCETNEKEKTAAIASAEAKAADLTAEIEARAATKGKLSTEIKDMKGQIAEDTASLKKATAIREKEAAEFRAEEKEMFQAITNLKNAVLVLSKHQSSLMQIDSPELASVRAVVQDCRLKLDLLQANRPGKSAALLSLGASGKAMDKTVASVLGLHSVVDVLPVDIAQHMLATAAKEVATGKSSSAFVQGAAAPTAGSYSPQSGQIFGILNQMKDEFEANLSQAQKDEMKAAAEFAELSKSKSAQIAAAKEKLDGMEGQLADNNKALADAKEDFELTTGQRSSDVEFLRNLRLTCQDLDRQWVERSKTRTLEMKAVSEALVVLTEDDNREHLAATVSLLQEGSVSDSSAQLRQSVVQALRVAVHQPAFEADDLLAAWKGRGTPVGGAGGPRTQLATLAVSAQLDSFTKVKELMDKMVADLKSQQEEEVKFKANCESEFDTTEKTTYEKKEEKADLEALIESLAKTITTLKEEIATAKTTIADTEVAIKKASETREKENAEFQTVVADQRATQVILKKALAKLEGFYGKKAAFLANAAAAKQTPPVQFNKYKNNAGASPVMGLLEQIIEDSVKLEKEATDGETEAQASYESFVKDSNDVISKLSDSVTEKTKAVSNAKVESEQAKSDLKSTDEEIMSLVEYEGDLHQECDFVLKNFNIRQAARLQEIESIQKAKSILSGAA